MTECAVFIAGISPVVHRCPRPLCREYLLAHPNVLAGLASEHRFAAGIPVFRGLWISSRTMSMRLLGAQCGGRVLLGCLTRGNQAADQREHHA
ncbi:hypothetical protein I118_1393 [Bifidobacterium longum D2957]|nr:hypothetical protein I118_1393 [Bifidobacterium longum D2957]